MAYPRSKVCGPFSALKKDRDREAVGATAGEPALATPFWDMLYDDDAGVVSQSPKKAENMIGVITVVLFASFSLTESEARSEIISLRVRGCWRPPSGSEPGAKPNEQVRMLRGARQPLWTRLLKTGRERATVPRRRILFAGFGARMGDTRLPTCGTFGELVGGASCVGVEEKEWIGCSLDDLKAFDTNAKVVEQGAASFIAEWIVVEKVRP